MSTTAATEKNEGFDQAALLDALIEKLQLKNDAALATALEVQPPVISKIRHCRMPVGASILITMNEVSDIPIKDLRALMGDRRAKFRGPISLGAQVGQSAP